MARRRLVLPEKGAEILFDIRDENVRLLESLFDVSGVPHALRSEAALKPG